MHSFTTRPRALGIAAIELAAVMAVTFVMAALAASTYRTYSARSEVSRSLLAVAPIKALIAHEFGRTGTPPASERDVLGFADALAVDQLPHAIAIEHGRIEIRFGNEGSAGLRGKTLFLTPFETTDRRIVWICGNTAADVGLYPLGFANGTNHTVEPAATVETRYLPDDCR